MELSPAAVRVACSLVEKALSTPQSYPLSLNALRTACNQATNREPVTEYDDTEIQAALDELRAHPLVKSVYARGSRVPKHAHLLDEHLDLDEAQTAVLAVLGLRGPQTVGELRLRTERMHAFADLEDVQHSLEGLAQHPFGALAVELPRQPGQSQVRWAHLLSGEPDLTTLAAPTGVRPTAAGAEVDALRAEVDRLRAELEALRSRLDAAGL